MDSTIVKIKKWSHGHQNIILDIIIILSLGLIALFWFHKDSLILYRDLQFFPNRFLTFFRALYVWDDIILDEMTSRVLSTIIPLEVFRIFSKVIGLSLSTSERLWFYILYTSAGLSMYYLTYIIIENKRDVWIRLACLSSAFFYMLNLYLAYYITTIFGVGINYFFLPLVLALYIKGIAENMGIKYILVLSIVFTFTSTSAMASPAHGIIEWFIIFLYFIYYVITEKRNRPKVAHASRFTLFFIISYVALNMFWILPYLYLGPIDATKTTQTYVSAGVTPTYLYSLNSVQILDALRLMGYFEMDRIWKGDPIYIWASQYSTPIFNLVSFFITILVFSSLLSKKLRRQSLFFAILAILGIFLLNGLLTPFVKLNQWIIDNIPYFVEIFRQPNQKFGAITVLAYSVLFGIAMANLYKFLTRITEKREIHLRAIIPKSVILTVFFLVFGLYAYPFWSGEIVHEEGSVIPSANVEIPSYYDDAKEWLAQQGGDFRILSLPLSLNNYAAYKWTSGYLGFDISSVLLGKITLSGRSAHGLSYLTAKIIDENSSDEIGKVLSLLNVKYILVHNDTNWKYIEDHRWWLYTGKSKIVDTLNYQKGIHLESRIGNLTFYINEYWNSGYFIYPATEIYFIDGSKDYLAELLPLINIDNKSAIFFSKENKGYLPNGEYNRIVPISFKKFEYIGNDIYRYNLPIPTKGTYTITISNDSQNFNLVIYKNGTRADKEQLYLKRGDILGIEYVNKNLIYNPSFENLTGWEGWLDRNYPMDNGTRIRYLKPSNDSIDGQYSVKLVAKKYSSFIYQYMDEADINATYLVTFYYKNMGGRPLRFIAYQILQDGSAIPNKDLMSSKYKLKKSTEWIEYKTLIKPLSNVEKIGLYFHSDSWGARTSINLIDGLRIVKLPSSMIYLNLSHSISIRPPEIHYEKINPVKYKIRVKNARGPYFLVFSKNYSPYWKAYIDDKPIFPVQHFMVNGYANSWYITKTGDYEIILFFWPQNLYYLGGIFSLFTFIISIYIIWMKK